MNYLKKLISVILLLSFAAYVSASGVKVSPSKLEISAKTSAPVTAKITVINPTDDIHVFKVYPDDFLDIIKISPASFTLEAGEKKEITVTIKSSGEQKISEALNTNISVIAKPLAETKFQTNAGVKIPLSILISASDNSEKKLNPAFYIILAIMLFGLGKIIFFFYRTKTK